MQAQVAGGDNRGTGIKDIPSRPVQVAGDGHERDQQADVVDAVFGLLEGHTPVNPRRPGLAEEPGRLDDLALAQSGEVSGP